MTVGRTHRAMAFMTSSMNNDSEAQQTNVKRKEVFFDNFQVQFREAVAHQKLARFLEVHIYQDFCQFFSFWIIVLFEVSFKTSWSHTAQKMKFSTMDFFRKCDQICSSLRIWLHLLKKSLVENCIFCAVSQKKQDVPYTIRRQ